MDPYMYIIYIYIHKMFCKKTTLPLKRQHFKRHKGFCRNKRKLENTTHAHAVSGLIRYEVFRIAPLDHAQYDAAHRHHRGHRGCRNGMLPVRLRVSHQRPHRWVHHLAAQSKEDRAMRVRILPRFVPQCQIARSRRLRRGDTCAAKRQTVRPEAG